MPKGVPGTGVAKGFATYRERQSATIEAMILEKAGTFGNKEFTAGSYLIKEPDGELSVMDKEAFDLRFERRREFKPRGPRKAKAAPVDGATAEAPASAETAQAVS